MQDGWPNAPYLVALVRVGAMFVNGRLAERPDGHPPAVHHQTPGKATPPKTPKRF
jgi:hypothetical protein